MAVSRLEKVTTRWVQGGLLAVVSTVALTLLVPLWLEVTRKLDEIQTARRDSVVWTIVQLEVEYLELERAALALDRMGKDGLPDLRRRFNVFYSRVETLSQSPIYRSAIADAGEADNLELVSKGVKNMLLLIDGPDQVLVGAKVDLVNRLQSLHVPIRRLVANGNFVLTARTEDDRKVAAQLVGRLGIASVVLFGGLLGLALLFLRLYVIYKSRANQNLQTSRRLSTVISTSPDAIIVADSDGFVRDFNPAAETLLGYSRKEALGRDVSRLITRPAGEGEGPSLSRQNFFNLRMSGVARNGRVIPLEVSQGVTSLDSQRVYVLFLRDITNRLEAEEALRSSRDKALAGERAKAQFLAVMSHEMRTPLNGILGVIELMKKVPRDEKDIHYLKLLESSGQVLLGHVNEVLDITEIEAQGIKLNKAPFNLDALLEETMESLRPVAKLRGNALSLDCMPPQLGHFVGDAMRLRQILANLISNAIKFTEHGEITVTVCADTTGDDRRIEIQVADTGLGIDPQQQDRVFDDFVRLDRGGQTQIEGTGLGLGIVRRIVTAMGGQIGVESIEGEGSLFWVTLTLEPANPDEQYEGTQPETFAPHIARPLDVLLVEDNATNRFVLREMLRQDGHRVTEAENGLIGAQLAQDHAFDVILMDINMPVMGGVEATQAIRSKGASRSSRIIALTAHVLDQDTGVYRDAGIDRVISKPVSHRNLSKAVSGATLHETRASSSPLLSEDILSQLISLLGADKTRDAINRVLAEGAALFGPLDVPTGCARDLQVQIHGFAGACATIGAKEMRKSLTSFEARIGRMEAVPTQSDWMELRADWAKTARALATFESRKLGRQVALPGPVTQA